MKGVVEKLKEEGTSENARKILGGRRSGQMVLGVSAEMCESEERKMRNFQNTHIPKLPPAPMR
jgi:hypothetical protein